MITRNVPNITLIHRLRILLAYPKAWMSADKISEKQVTRETRATYQAEDSLDRVRYTYLIREEL